MSFELDKIDKRIIYRIVENARETTAPEVANEVEVTDTTIRNRIERLEENGVITGKLPVSRAGGTDGLTPFVRRGHARLALVNVPERPAPFC